MIKHIFISAYIYSLSWHPLSTNHSTCATMRTILFIVCFFLYTDVSVAQYATKGTGVLRNEIWWFDWNGMSVTDGATRNFVTDDGLSVTVSFSGVSAPVLTPMVMNTWSGAVLHVLYDFLDPNIKPALYKYDQSLQTRTFTMNITATRNGSPVPFTLVTADAEASSSQEVTTFTTNGSAWTTLEFFRNSSQTINPLSGCGSQTVVMNNTYAGAPVLGQNPILATQSSSGGQMSVTTSMQNQIVGGMAVAFGIFSAVDRGDLPPSYGYVQHRIAYTSTNGCSFMPPFPQVVKDTRLFLGNVSPDADNIQTTDDNLVGVDEEAFTAFPVYDASGTYTLVVPLQNTTGANAYLTGWLDSDLSGSFSNTERASVVVAPNATSATLTWTGLPGFIAPGTSADFGLRFRLTTSQVESQSPTGPATDGEVEDYLITRREFTGSDCTLSETDFGFSQSLCNPLEIQFNSYTAGSATWDFGDATTGSGTSPTHQFADYGTYSVTLEVRPSPSCVLRAQKNITVDITRDSVIVTNDTVFCVNTTGQLNALEALDYCWFPATGLSATNIANPVASAPATATTYFLHARVKGNNLIRNGDFEQGNTDFYSQYNYVTPNTSEGQYYVSSNPRNWNPGLSNCTDHTTGSGNMLLVNGSPALNQVVWQQTVTITPNTNYAFSTWIQSLSAANPAQLRFSINGQIVSNLIAAGTLCSWKQFFVSWNSGANTSAIISIVNQNTIAAGNDFALDDISFAPVRIIRDSIVIDTETPSVTATGSSPICKDERTQLSASGASTYLWSPATGLDDATIANPVAAPSSTTLYTVAGTTARGCTATDQLSVNVLTPPAITITADTTICKNTVVQLHASGGVTYQWTPAASLTNALSPDPVASPGQQPTRYIVEVTDANNCKNKDSVDVSIRPDPVFAITTPSVICQKDTILLTASGGHLYQWLPAHTLQHSDEAITKAFPLTTTHYTVNITDTACHESAMLSTVIAVNNLPSLRLEKSNDIDCIRGSSQLTAAGAFTYSWTPVNSLSNPSSANPIATPSLSTMYVVKATDRNNCSAYDSIKVDIRTDLEGMYLMPTAFTPNGDGLNDCYGIKWWGLIGSLDFSVYNRWGEKVFQTSHPNGCWDGRFKGQLQAGGVYVYQIRAQTLCGTIVKKGTFVLIR